MNCSACGATLQRDGSCEQCGLGPEPGIDPNPYAPPRSDEPLNTMGLNIEGNALVVAQNPVTLPPGCVSCGAPIDSGHVRISKKLTWAPKWILLLILVNMLILLVVYFIVRKVLAVDFGLCAQCNRTIRKKRLITAGAWLATVALFVGSYLANSELVFIVALLMFLAALIMAILHAQPLRLKRYRKPWFYVVGMEPSYLDRVRAQLNQSSS